MASKSHKSEAAESLKTVPASPRAFAKLLAAECSAHGIRRTAARAKLPVASLARKVNDPKTLTANDMERMAPLFGFDVTHAAKK